MKRVFIALKMAGVAGREKLSGIFRFLGDNHDWDITLIRTAAEFTPARMRRALAEGYDGFIVSIPDTETTAVVCRAQRPAAFLSRSTTAAVAPAPLRVV